MLSPATRVLAVSALAFTTLVTAAGTSSGVQPDLFPMRNGVVTGTVNSSPAAFASRFVPMVTAFRMDVPGQVASVTASPSGAFRLSLPPGLWSVNVPTWSGGRLSYRGHAIPVASGRQAAFRGSERAGSQPPPYRIAAEGWSTGGEFPSEVGPGFEGLMIHGAIQALSKTCGDPRTADAVVVENRDGAAHKGVLREIRLGLSRYASPQFRAEARQALRNQKAWAPTHKIKGTISTTTTNGVSTHTATVRLVNLTTGRTEWQQTYSASNDNSFWANVTDIAGQDLATRLCGPPQGLHIAATATVRGEDADASGTARLKVEYDVWSRPDEPYLYWVDAPVTWTVTGSTFAGMGDCPKVSTGTASTTESVFVGQGAAALNRSDRSVNVFIGSSVATTWQETTPPDECTAQGSLFLLFNVVDLAVPLGGTATATGSTHPGVTYDITASVTPIVSRP